MRYSVVFHRVVPRRKGAIADAAGAVLGMRGIGICGHCAGFRVLSRVFFGLLVSTCRPLLQDSCKSEAAFPHHTCMGT
jgi:hypothetical protein